MYSFCFFFSANELAWRNDEEFGRQMLAGTNPARIQVSLTIIDHIGFDNQIKPWPKPAPFI